ncbi:Single-stranded DNA-binding protein [uncultured Paludibacter sp.]|uniref:Single-stranded DNA-binding protein n=1 Tax=uncultured Paludibacter sp. TaxID=497635 RepID=A0A653AD96_9BACT|nr:Single-stranded DNA-binding protein [uncultured Paludibacter sp.]
MKNEKTLYICHLFLIRKRTRILKITHIIIMSINKAILVGNVGRDPEVRYLEKNVAVANFTLATTERGYTMQNGTQVPDRTEWHNIVAWRGLAELAEKHIKKGSQLYVEGKIQTRSWEKDGVKRYTTEIYAETIQLLGKRPDSNETTSTPSAAQSSATSTPAEPMEEGTDDLPF